MNCPPRPRARGHSPSEEYHLLSAVLPSVPEVDTTPGLRGTEGLGNLLILGSALKIAEISLLFVRQVRRSPSIVAAFPA